jgi:hypothetical protein
MAEKKKNAPRVKQPSAGDYLRTLGDMLVVNPRNSPAATLGGAAYDYATRSTPQSVVRDIRSGVQGAEDWLRKQNKALRANPVTGALQLLKAGYIDPLADPFRVFQQAATERSRGNESGGAKLAAMVPLAVAGVVNPQLRGTGRVAANVGVDVATKTAKKAATPSVKVTPKAKPSSPRFAPASQEPVVSQAGRMGVPVIGREQMAVQHPSKFGPYATIKPRRPESEVEITREPSVNMAPSEVFDVEKLQNSLIVPLYGDKSIAGERITSINDVPVSVETYGGPRYGALNAAVGSPSGWASELPQISALRNQIRGGLEQGRDVYGVYTAMSPRAADQTTMMADALLQQAQQAPIRKADVKAFDEAARQIVPNFAGIMHPEAYQQLLGAKQGQRKSLVELMDTAKALEAGLPDVSATRMALTTPELMYAPGGSTGFQVVKFGPESLEPVDVSLVHPTYGTQMAGTPVGHFEQQIPFDMLYPDLIKERRALGLSPGKDLRSFEFRKPTQVVDQETLDLVMKYLQDTQGAE